MAVFQLNGTSLIRGPSGNSDTWAKTYEVPEELDLLDLVEMAEHSAYSVAPAEVRFYEECRRAPERWSFDRFYAAGEDGLRDILSVSFEIPELNACIKIYGEQPSLYFYPPQPDRWQSLGLDELLGKLPEQRRVKRPEGWEKLGKLLRRAYFQDEPPVRYLDDVSGWFMSKLYKLQEGRKALTAVTRFLKERPDLREARRYDGSWGDFGRSFREDPTYLLVGSVEECKAFAAEEAELAAACGKENIHLIGGSCAAFWDAFDRKDYWLEIAEYPGSADDAATCGEVTLCCEDHTKRGG